MPKIKDNTQNLPYQQLLRDFAPFIKMHKDETLFPIHYDTYVKNSKLILHSADNKKSKEIKMANIIDELNKHTPDEIIKDWFIAHPEDQEHYHGGFLTFSPDIDAQGMSGDFDSNTKKIKSAPVATYAKPVRFKSPNTDITTELIRLTYVFIYQDNKPDFCCGAGQHNADIERCEVYVKQDKNGKWIIDRAYYGAHGSYEGEWVKGDKIEMVNDHPAVCIAKGSHATYKSKKTGYRLFSKDTNRVLRVFGFANDLLGDTYGYQIKPEDLYDMPTPIARNYANIYADKQRHVALGKSYIEGTENKLSTSFLARLLPKELSIGKLTLWNPEKVMSVDHEFETNGTQQTPGK